MNVILLERVKNLGDLGDTVKVTPGYGRNYLLPKGIALPAIAGLLPWQSVVLSVSLPRHDPSPRFKEVVHPTAQQWLHHLEVQDLADLDAEVEAWLAAHPLQVAGK